MQNEMNRVLNALTVEQTDALLSGIDASPVDASTARRIRRKVEKAAVPKRLRRKATMRVLVPIAACLVAITLVFACFPQAAQAIASFLGLNYTPSRYMGELPSSRTPIPSVEEALDAASPSDGDYSISLLSELDGAPDFAGYREELGLEPFSADDWSWVKEIRPEIAEVLYDGSSLIWNTNIYTTNAHVQSFMNGYIPGLTTDQRADAMLEAATYTVEGDPTVYELIDTGGGLTPIFDDAERASADHVVLYSDFYLPDDQPLPDGLLTITQTIRITEDDAMSSVTTVARITHTFTFDTTAGNTPSAESVDLTVALSGETYLSASHKELADDGSLLSYKIDTQKVSLDGVSLGIHVEYLATGIHVYARVEDAPDDWTQDMISGLQMQNGRTTFNTFEGSGTCADLYIDGEFVTEAPWSDRLEDYPLSYLLPIFPEEYASTGDVTVQLLYSYFTMLNGTDQIAGDVFTDSNVQFDAETETIPLAEISIPLP